MKKLWLLLILICCFSNCKSSKRTKRPEVIVKKEDSKKTRSTVRTEPTKETPKTELEKTKTYASKSLEQHIIDYAKSFEGVKYRWGGTTNSGMDCSGLVFESFKAHEIYLPRISRDMAKKGDKIKLKQTQKGDLLFFKTRNRRNDINHVGLVVDIRDNDIMFIHATTRAGVIISSLNESYWLNAFEEVRRVL